jgi:SAM-dependent methyltransferase
MKNSDSNHILYEKLSGLYEWAFKPLFTKAIQRTVKLLASYDVKKVLEVGCGTGYGLEFYPKGLSVVATDLSEQMVEISSKRAVEAKANIKVLNIKDTDKVVAEGPYDAVVSFSVITVVNDPQAFLDDLKSYCKPGGHIFIIMHQRGRWLFRVIDLFWELPVRLLFGFTLQRRIVDYKLHGLRIVEEKAHGKTLGYVYNDLIVLRKDL